MSLCLSAQFLNSVHGPSCAAAPPPIDYDEKPRPRAHRNMIVNHIFIRLMSHLFALINNKQVLFPASQFISHLAGGPMNIQYSIGMTDEDDQDRLLPVCYYILNKL